MPISANPQASDLGFCDHETGNLGLTQQSPRRGASPRRRHWSPNCSRDLQRQDRRRQPRYRSSRALSRSVPCRIGARATLQRTGNAVHLAMGSATRGRPTLGRRPTGSASWQYRATHRVVGLARSTRLAISDLQESRQDGKSGYKSLASQRSGAVGASLEAPAVGE